MIAYPNRCAVDTQDDTVNTRARKTKNDKSVPNAYGLLETAATAGTPLGKFWRLRECDTDLPFGAMLPDRYSSKSKMNGSNQ